MAEPALLSEVPAGSTFEILVNVHKDLARALADISSIKENLGTHTLQESGVWALIGEIKANVTNLRDELAQQRVESREHRRILGERLGALEKSTDIRLDALEQAAGRAAERRALVLRIGTAMLGLVSFAAGLAVAVWADDIKALGAWVARHLFG